MKDVCLIGRDAHQNVLKYLDDNLKLNGFASHAISLNSQPNLSGHIIRNSKCVVFFVDKQFVLDENCATVLDCTVKLAQKNKLYYFAVLMEGNSFDELVNGLSAEEREQNASRVNALLQAFPDSKLFIDYNSERPNYNIYAHYNYIQQDDALFYQESNLTDTLVEICHSLSIHGLGKSRKRFVCFTSFCMALPLVLLLATLFDLSVRFSNMSGLFRYTFYVCVVLSAILSVLQFIFYKWRVFNLFVKITQLLCAFFAFMSFFNFMPVSLPQTSVLYTVLIMIGGAAISIALAYVCYFLVYKKLNLKKYYRQSDDKISSPKEKYDIFISYSHKDTDLAQDLYKELHFSGYKTLLDSCSMCAGDDWRQKAHSFVNAARCTIFLVSPDSVRSKAVAEEIRASLQRIKSQPDRKYTMFAFSANGDDLDTILQASGITDKDIKDLYADTTLRSVFLDQSFYDEFDGLEEEKAVVKFRKIFRDKKIRQSNFLSNTILTFGVGLLVFLLVGVLEFAMGIEAASSIVYRFMLLALSLPLWIGAFEIILYMIYLKKETYLKILLAAKSIKLFLTPLSVSITLKLIITYSGLLDKLQPNWSNEWWGWCINIVTSVFVYASPIFAFLFLRFCNQRYYKYFENVDVRNCY